MDGTKTVTLPDGRTLAYGIYGAGDDAPAKDIPTVFHFHGLPGSHHEAAVFSASAARHGVRIIGVSRPGSSLSSPRPNRTLLDFPADVVALADHLEIDRFAVLGVSGGGPNALACWHLIPRTRLVGAALVASVLPASLSLAGMNIRTRMVFTVAKWVPSLVAWVFDWQLGALARDDAHPERLEQQWDADLASHPGPDLEAWRTDAELRSALVKGLREAVRRGGSSTAWEFRLLATDWGFQLGQLAAEPGQMVFWQGDMDTNVPLATLRKAVPVIPGAELRVSKGDGHLSLLKQDEIVATLKDMLRR